MLSIMGETKEYYANGWSHFIDCINFNSSDFDAEAIEFMNEFPRHIMDFLDSRDALLEACKNFPTKDESMTMEQHYNWIMSWYRVERQAAIELAEKEGAE